MPEVVQFDVHLFARECVERAERFVHQQNGRPVQQRTAQRDALLHPARELVRVRVFEAAQAGQFDQLVGAFFRLGAIHAADLRLQQDVRSGAAPLEQGRALEHEADLALRSSDAPAEEFGRAARGTHEPRCHFQ